MIDAIDAEQAKIDAFHAVGAATVIDHRIPPPTHFVATNDRRRNDRKCRGCDFMIPD